MTAQRDLGLVWAFSGGTLPVDSTKYQNGWVAEIPTYQQFNYMVQGIDQNVLHLAEEGVFDWQDNITYAVGAKVKRTNVMYVCIANSLNNDPDLDSTNSYWVTGGYVGEPTTLKETDGFRLDFGFKSQSTWLGQEQTVYGTTPMVGYFTSDNSTNWGVANYSGELVAVDLGTATDTIPDSRNINKTGPNSHRLFHEGHLPTVSEVVGGVEEAPNDNKLYARKGITATTGQWEEVTTTTVSTSPPPPVRGAGQGWFNLDDGQLYIDVDDGDSEQWVPANSPYVPASIGSGSGSVTPDAVNIVYDNTTSGLTATEVQSALDELATTAPSTAAGISFDDSVVGEGNTTVQDALQDVWLRLQQLEGGS